jgi:hypothetical protein
LVLLWLLRKMSIIIVRPIEHWISSISVGYMSDFMLYELYILFYLISQTVSWNYYYYVSLYIVLTLHLKIGNVKQLSQNPNQNQNGERRFFFSVYHYIQLVPRKSRWEAWEDMECKHRIWWRTGLIQVRKPFKVIFPCL